LYRLARQGKEIAREPRAINIERLQLRKLNDSEIAMDVSCSGGTYVRTLAADMGKYLGCGAHLTSLRRTRSGDFTEAGAVHLQGLSAENLIPMDQMLASWPRIEVGGTDEDRVVHGNPIPGSGSIPFARIFNKKGEFIALASVENGLVRPRLVLTSITSG